MTARRTIAVIGGGSAGFKEARTAARHGARVLFFMGDNADLASLCVNRGCMPSKALFDPIDTLHRARKQRGLSVEPIRPEAYLAGIVAWKDREIARFQAYRQRAIAQHEGKDFRVLCRDARFVDSHTVQSLGEQHRFDAAIVATGSRPDRPSIDGLEDLQADLWTTEDILANTIPSEWDRRSNIQVFFSDPEFGYCGVSREEAEADGYEVVSTSKESRLVGKLHLGGDDHGFGEFIADANSGELLGAGLLCLDASDLIHLPDYLIDHRHTVQDGTMAEYYHPTRTEIVPGILDRLCRMTGGHLYKRADEQSG